MNQSMNGWMNEGVKEWTHEHMAKMHGQSESEQRMTEDSIRL